jgi:hypothetical protein
LEATPFRYTSTAVQSSVDVILSNPNGATVYGKLTVQVVQPNGVARTVVVPSVEIPKGNSVRRVLVLGAITGVRWARVSSLVI